MKKIYFIATLILATFCLGFSVKAGEPQCADNYQEVNVLDPSIIKMQRETQAPDLNLFSKFKSTGGADFHVLVKNGNLRVRSSEGEFPAVVCRSSKGLQASLGLSLLQKMHTGMEQVNVNIVPKGKDTIEVSSNLRGSEATRFLLMR